MGSEKRRNKKMRVDGLTEDEKSISTDFTADEKHPLMNEKQISISDDVIVKPHQKKDDQDSITNKRIIKEKQTISPNLFAKSMKKEEEKDGINANIYQTENQKDSTQKRTHKEKEMIPLRVFDGSIGKIDSFKTQKKKDRWDGPHHPLRSICRM